MEIFQPFPISEAGLRVVLRNGNRAVTLVERRADTFIEFADVYWPPGNASVAVFLCGEAVAYDLNQQTLTSFLPFRAQVAQHIQAEYRVPKNLTSAEQVFSWACTDGHGQFMRHFPTAAAR